MGCFTLDNERPGILKEMRARKLTGSCSMAIPGHGKCLILTVKLETNRLDVKSVLKLCVCKGLVLRYHASILKPAILFLGRVLRFQVLTTLVKGCDTLFKEIF